MQLCKALTVFACLTLAHGAEKGNSTDAQLACTFGQMGFESAYTSPFGAARVAGAHTITETQRRAYASLFAKMDRREPVFWLGVGGSFFGGRKCADKRNIGGAKCSYSFQLATALRASAYNMTISDDGGQNSDASSGLAYRNVAMSGVTTGGILPSLPKIFDAPYVNGMTPDLLMVDFSTNDDGEKQDWGAAEQTTAGHTLGRATNDSARDEEVLAATEALVRYMLEKHPRTALLFVEGFCYATWTLRVRERVGTRYGVPVVPAKALFTEPVPSPRCWRGGPALKHQPYYAHERLAHGLHAWWCAFRKRIRKLSPQPQSPMPSPIASSELRDRFRVCDAPLSVYDAIAMERGVPVDSQPAVIAGNWTLYADRPEKPGWISDDEGIIEYPLKFGASPRIMIVFTQGYEGFDDAFVSMPDSSTNRFTLAGTHRAHVTQSELLVINAKQNGNEQLVGGVKGFGVAPHTEHVLRIQKNKGRGKVKITWVSSC